MALRTATPWWLTWQHLLGLLLFFVSQRFLGHWDTFQTVATGLALAALTFAVVARVIAVARTRGDRRRVERTLLIATLASVVAIACWYLSTDAGAELAGVAQDDPKALARWSTPLEILAGIFGLASVLPMVMVEATLGLARRELFDLKTTGGAAGSGDGAVEHRRVREVATSGLTLALAAALLMVTCSVARQRNMRADVSYFKTSAPGASTQNIVKSIEDPIAVHLFFTSPNEVLDEVAAYFDELADATGRLTVEQHDPVVAAGIVSQFGVKESGTIVLVRGEQNEKITIDTDIERARRSTKSSTKPTLRTFDGAVNAALMKLARSKRVAYLTVGHGEINDPDSLAPALREQLPEARTTMIKAMLRDQNYEVKDLGAMDGLVDAVPEDAAIVMVLGPRTALSEDELATLDRYVAGGGSLLVALDPLSDVVLGPLEQRFAIKMDHTPIVDDKEYLPTAGPRVALTNQFSSHKSITAMARAASNAGLPLFQAGSLDDVEFGGAADQAPRKTFVIKSMQSSFRDANGNARFDDGEKRDRYNIAVAIEGPKPASAPDGGAGDDGDAARAEGYRAMVFSDADLFADRIDVKGRQLMVYRQTNGGPLPDDVIRWLGGEEDLAGAITDELDKPLAHTSSQDAKWFVLTIIAAPLLVLGGGLAATRRRRRKPAAAAPRKDAPSGARKESP